MQANFESSQRKKQEVKKALDSTDEIEICDPGDLFESHDKTIHTPRFCGQRIRKLSEKDVDGMGCAAIIADSSPTNQADGVHGSWTVGERRVFGLGPVALR